MWSVGKGATSLDPVRLSSSLITFLVIVLFMRIVIVVCRPGFISFLYKSFY